MTDLRKTIARSSSRGPDRASEALCIKLPSIDMAALKGRASLLGVNAQDLVRKLIARELAR